MTPCDSSAFLLIWPHCGCGCIFSFPLHRRSQDHSAAQNSKRNENIHQQQQQHFFLFCFQCNRAHSPLNPPTNWIDCFCLSAVYNHLTSHAWRITMQETKDSRTLVATLTEFLFITGTGKIRRWKWAASQTETQNKTQERIGCCV